MQYAKRLAVLAVVVLASATHSEAQVALPKLRPISKDEVRYPYLRSQDVVVHGIPKGAAATVYAVDPDGGTRDMSAVGMGIVPIGINTSGILTRSWADPFLTSGEFASWTPARGRELDRLATLDFHAPANHSTVFAEVLSDSEWEVWIEVEWGGRLAQTGGAVCWPETAPIQPDGDWTYTGRYPGRTATMVVPKTEAPWIFTLASDCRPFPFPDR